MTSVRHFFGLFLFAIGQTAFAQEISSCALLSHDRIFGRDVSSVVPELKGLPPDLVVGFSPTPGLERSFSPLELQRLANRNGITAPVSTRACFMWQMRTLTKDYVVTALQKTLSGHDPDLEIVDYCRNSVPMGELVFPMQGLTAQTSQPAVWIGYVAYADSRKFSVWVKVRVTVHEREFKALRSLRAGQVIEDADYQQVPYNGPLRRGVRFTSEDVVGKKAIRPIEIGSVISSLMLSKPVDVEKQQIVTVRIDLGAAHIETQGMAIEAGCRGAVIKVKNLRSGRIFLARINDRSVVTVVPGGDVGLVVEDHKS